MNEEKDTEDDARKKEIVELMRSKAFCEATFLGPDEELDDRIAEDNQVLASRGITHKQICDVLKSVLHVYGRRYNEKDGYRFLGNIASKEKTVYCIEGKTCLGSQPCPFEVCGHESCDYERHHCQSEVVVKKAALLDSDEKKGSEKGKAKPYEQFEFGSLLIHLIEEHQFFEGKDLPYRVDPKEVIEFFGLQPNLNYENWFQSADTKLVSHYDWLPEIFYLMQGVGGAVYTS